MPLIKRDLELIRFILKATIFLFEKIIQSYLVLNVQSCTDNFNGTSKTLLTDGFHGFPGVKTIFSLGRSFSFDINVLLRNILLFLAFGFLFYSNTPHAANLE